MFTLRIPTAPVFRPLLEPARYKGAYGGRGSGKSQQRFQKSWPIIEWLGFDERFKRTWEYYLAYCQAGFEVNAISVGLYKFTHQ